MHGEATASCGPRRGGRRGPAGYSLTEAMVVLVIIGIVLAISVPNFVRISARDRVEAAAYDLDRNLALARQKAVAKRRPYRLTANPYDRTYYVERQEGGSWVRDPLETFSVHPQIDFDIVLGGNPANRVLVFEPQGTIAADDAPGLFVFSGQEGDTARVTIVRTGRIRTRVD